MYPWAAALEAAAQVNLEGARIIVPEAVTFDSAPPLRHGTTLFGKLSRTSFFIKVQRAN